MKQVTAFSNPLVKLAKGLREKKIRRREGLFLAEGLRILTEARDSGKLPAYLLFSQPAHDRLESLIQETERAGGEVIETSRDILHKISGKDNPQSVVGLYPHFDTRLEGIDRDTGSIWFVGQALRDPGNLGTILRTGDAVGAGGLILLDDCADPFSPEAVRASMGAIFTQSVAAARWEDFRRWLREGPGELVGASLNASIDYRLPDYGSTVFLLVGNESQGLPEACEAECDRLVRIPMLGRADSLNAAVAAAILAYQVLGQRCPPIRA